MIINKIPDIDILFPDSNVGTISPSAYNNICWYPLVFRRFAQSKFGGEYRKFLIPSLSRHQYLGSIIHELFEKRIHGLVPDKVTYFSMWSELTTKKEKEILELYPSLSFFDLTDYNKMYSSCLSAMNIKPIEICNQQHTGIHKCTEVRVFYEDLILGYIDKVTFIHGDSEIIDYKSGSILDNNNNIKETYINQLNLYAICYENTFNRKVVKLTIVHTDSLTEYDVPILRDDYISMIEQIKNKVSVINKHIRNNTIENIQILHEHCKYSEIRHLCKTYINSNLQDKKIVIGDVIECFNRGTLVLRNLYGKAISISKWTDQTNQSAQSALIGKRLAFTNVLQPVDGKYKKTDRTIVYELPKL